MRLHHLHLPAPIPYIHSLRLQEALLSAHFAHKALQRTTRKDTTTAPNPTLLTFETYPTYTVGRRHLTANPLSDEQIAFLTRGLSSLHSRFNGRAPVNEPDPRPSDAPELATFFASPRGGLLTYHAPGQLTAYLVLNLRAHNLTPRCYIRMLENTVIRTCAKLGLPDAMTTEDPGVWIGERRPNTSAEKPVLVSTGRKICAIGVQVSRGVTSHGIGLNVWDASIESLALNAEPGRRRLFTLPTTSSHPEVSLSADFPSLPSSPGTLAPGYLSWGFSRIVACGLEGRSVTWLDREIANFAPQNSIMRTVAETLAAETATSLNLDADVVNITPASFEEF